MIGKKRGDVNRPDAHIINIEPVKTFRLRGVSFIRRVDVQHELQKAYHVKKAVVAWSEYRRTFTAKYHFLKYYREVCLNRKEKETCKKSYEYCCQNSSLRFPVMVTFKAVIAIYSVVLLHAANCKAVLETAEHR